MCEDPDVGGLVGEVDAEGGAEVEGVERGGGGGGLVFMEWMELSGQGSGR